MKSLFDLCRPRQSVFDEGQRDDVLHLMNLIDQKIDPELFFSENYVTEGMKELLDVSFKRFMRKGATGLIKLTQAMGGGKTHNMIALGLLAMYPAYREQLLSYPEHYRKLGSVRVVAFNGRNSDAEFGIWGEIAEQLNKKALFNRYYTPLQAPGEEAWINLLQGDPLLILLDELPPYLENAKSITVGNSDLSVVTATALSNLFSALGKEELSNVCIVLSDLEATYESGSALIRSSFKNLSNEVNRTSCNIEPVGSASDEIYHILRKRLFDELPTKEEINEVAVAYQKAVLEAKQMGYTNDSPEQIYVGIKEAYPFHPLMRNLYARFKENPGFQQTRGLIRLMRRIVAGLYQDNAELAHAQYLVHVYDFNLNDRGMRGELQSIKSSLTQAMATDIAAKGKAFAEQIDQQNQNCNASDAAKLILAASLADVPNPLLGLTPYEVVGGLCAPGRDTAQLKRALDDFSMKSWYLQQDKKGRLFFQNTRNMIAEMQSLTDSYSNEDIRATTLKKFLERCFSPQIGDCYQSLTIFPAADEIHLEREKVTLVLFEPHEGQRIHPDLQGFYEQTRYKNRVMFLSGGRDIMTRLYSAAKELKAIEQILHNLKNESNTAEDNPQYQLAKDTRVKKINAVLSASRETFVKLYFPMRDKLQEADFMMEFKDNEYSGEDQIRKLLMEKRKFTREAPSDTMRDKCEKRLFTRKEMMKSELRDRAAMEVSWQWYHPRMLDDLVQYCISHDDWRMNGDHIEKGPFAKEPTSLAVDLRSDAYETGAVVLKIVPRYGDRVFYEKGRTVSEESSIIGDLNHFETAALELSFLCMDTSGEHPTGDVVIWKRPIHIKHKMITLENGIQVTLEAPYGVKLRYTLDETEPNENGFVYNAPFFIYDDIKMIRVVAIVGGECRASESIPVEYHAKKTLSIHDNVPLVLDRKVRASDTQSCYRELTLMNKFDIRAQGVNFVLSILDDYASDSYIELNVGGRTNIVTAASLETTIANLREVFASDRDVSIQMEISALYFPTGRAFYDYNNAKGIGLDDYGQGEIKQDA